MTYLILSLLFAAVTEQPVTVIKAGTLIDGTSSSLAGIRPSSSAAIASKAWAPMSPRHQERASSTCRT
jgi:hypothetical protein